MSAQQWVHENHLYNEQASVDVSTKPGYVPVVRVDALLKPEILKLGGRQLRTRLLNYAMTGSGLLEEAMEMDVSFANAMAVTHQ